MAGKENPIFASLDDANALQSKIRQRARWMIERLSDRELLAVESWLEDIIKATEGTQAALRELRAIEHDKKPKREVEKERQEAFGDAPDLYQQLM